MWVKQNKKILSLYHVSLSLSLCSCPSVRQSVSQSPFVRLTVVCVASHGQRTGRPRATGRPSSSSQCVRLSVCMESKSWTDGRTDRRVHDRQRPWDWLDWMDRRMYQGWWTKKKKKKRMVMKKKKEKNTQHTCRGETHSVACEASICPIVPDTQNKEKWREF